MTWEPRLRGASGALRPARIVLGVAIALLISPAAWAGFDAAATFGMKCAGCHSVGKGVVVGPDLAGVTARHDKPWLHSFIRSSQGMVKRKDAAATVLFSKFKKKMPDHDFSDEEIDALLAFIQAGGPRDGAGEIRRASAATPAEVARGRELFVGRRMLRNGGAACANCHDAGRASDWGAGSLASDLTRVYDKYQDAGLTRALVESRFPLMATAYRDRPLTADEVYVLKAFLYAASRTPEPPLELASGAPFFLGFGGSSLVLLFTGRILRRRGSSGKGSADDSD